MSVLNCPSCRRELEILATKKKGSWTSYCPECNLRIFWSPRKKSKPKPESKPVVHDVAALATGSAIGSGPKGSAIGNGPKGSAIGSKSS